MTPLLRELAPIPIFGSASRTKTSLQRLERARAMAQPTTPPPIITMLARSTVYSLALDSQACFYLLVEQVRKIALTVAKIVDGPATLKMAWGFVKEPGR